MLSRLLIVFTIVYGIAGPSVAQEEGRKTYPASLQYRLGLLKDRPEDQFKQIEYDKIAPAIRSQVDNYLAMTLTSDAQPQKDPQIKARD